MSTILKQYLKNYGRMELMSKIELKDIEAGADFQPDIEVIGQSPRARVLYLSLVKSAPREVLLVFPTTGAFIRQEKMGVLQSCEEL